MLKAYTFLVHIIYWIISLLGIRSEKLGQFYRSKTRQVQIPIKQNRRILIHCASMGEFEMAKSTASKLKEKSIEVVVSFFSPSGYEHTPETSEYFDYKVYLPMDTPDLVAEFLENIQPDYILFIKSEIWPNLIDQTVKKGIPFSYLGMDFTGNQDKYFSFPMNLLLKPLLKAEHFFVQTKQTAETLLKNEINETQISICRNPRVDAIVNESNQDSIYFALKPAQKLFVFGSVYNEDIPMIKSCLDQFPDCIFYIFPHHLDETTINNFKKAFTDINIFDGTYEVENTLVFEMGLLKHIYKYAQSCYVGGGFQSGIHNILEPILNNCNCIIGPKNKSFPEVQYFEDSSYLYKISKPAEIVEAVHQMINRVKDKTQVDRYLNMSKNCQDNLILLILQSISPKT